MSSWLVHDKTTRMFFVCITVGPMTFPIIKCMPLKRKQAYICSASTICLTQI